MELGDKIKYKRTLLQLTQEELANRCELTKGYISQLENNKTSPSIETLTHILEVLGTSLSDFFHEEVHPQIVFGIEEQYDKEFNDYLQTWLVPTSQMLTMEPVLVTINVGGKTVKDMPHNGEEFGYVIKGMIEVCYGNDKHICNEGEAFYITTNKIHYINNIGSIEAKVVWVSTPPNF